MKEEKRGNSIRRLRIDRNKVKLFFLIDTLKFGDMKETPLINSLYIQCVGVSSNHMMKLSSKESSVNASQTHLIVLKCPLVEGCLTLDLKHSFGDLDNRLNSSSVCNMWITQCLSSLTRRF